MMSDEAVSNVDRPIRVLVVGSLPPPIGGASVLLQQLVDELRERSNVDLAVIDTSGIRGSGCKVAVRFVSVVWRIIRQIRRADVVSLHAASTGILIMGGVLLLLSRVFRTPLLIRSFGGTYYPDKFGKFRCSLVRRIVGSIHLFLVETKAMVRSAKEEGIRRVVWYPNSRPLREGDDPSITESGPCRKFVYVGHVRPVKGIKELIEAGERFGDDVTIDVYGPFLDGLSESTFEGLKTVRYRGVLSPDQVVPTLKRYQAFLLPSYHPGEGYPGVVLEAYRAGLPVITTRWRAIPEIVDETCGILVAPHSVDELFDAMQKLVEDPDLYNSLYAGVRVQRRLFDSQLWTDRFTDHCRALAGRSGITDGRLDDLNE